MRTFAKPALRKSLRLPGGKPRNQEPDLQLRSHSDTVGAEDTSSVPCCSSGTVTEIRHNRPCPMLAVPAVGIQRGKRENKDKGPNDTRVLFRGCSPRDLRKRRKFKTSERCPWSLIVREMSFHF